MKSFESERSLTAPVRRHLRSAGFAVLVEELQFFDHRIDVYGYARGMEITVAVELKLTDWRRAFEQALLYQLCADQVYVALPASSIARVDQSRLLRHGIGLLAVETRTRCREILAPVRSTALQQGYRTGYVELLSGGIKWKNRRRA